MLQHCASEGVMRYIGEFIFVLHNFIEPVTFARSAMPLTRRRNYTLDNGELLEELHLAPEWITVHWQVLYFVMFL